jgi:hypothetical protein
MKQILIYLIIAIAGLIISFAAIEGYLIKYGVATEIFIFCMGFTLFAIGAYCFGATIFIKFKTNNNE